LVRLGVVLDAHAPPHLARMCELAGIDAIWTSDAEALRTIAATTQRIILGLNGIEPPQGIPSDRIELAVPCSLAADTPRGSVKRGLLLERNTASECAIPVVMADDAVIDATRIGGIAHVPGVIDMLRQGCQQFRRDPATLGIALEVPVCVGRTYAEAAARAGEDRRFEDVGIFGTLEQCQSATVALAHAGVTDLRCFLPDAPDLPDVIAQLTAMVIGSAAVLSPNAPRSPDPAPPEGWGGRPRFPRPQLRTPSADTRSMSC
jgi:hypothetical protein